MEKLIKELSNIIPFVNFEEENQLISSGKLDSLSLVSIMLMINETYGVEIPIEFMTPENFDSASAIYAIIQKLQKSKTE